MSIALLVAANPKVSTGGPVVRLRSGTYAINVEGQVDSDLILHVEGYEGTNGIRNKMRLTFDEPTDVQVKFGRPGNESHINVFAERQ